jgi:hypothetical protein
MSRAVRAFILAALALTPSAARAASAPPAPSPGSARLQGQFLLTGHVTVARNVRGERAGQNVMRTWTFAPACAARACATTSLIRARSGGSDKLVLHRRRRGYYVGNGSFYAPLRCGQRTYNKGEAVPFTITVRVTATTVSAGVVFATGVSASYTNRSRRNLTSCVAVLGHDAATYRGHLIAL